MQFIRRIGIAAVRFATVSLSLSAASSVCTISAKAWKFKTLYDFTGGADGRYPDGRLLSDPATGDLYGVASGGGDKNCRFDGCGVIYKLAVDGHLTVLHTFTKKHEGIYPYGGMVKDEANNLYGTTSYGGRYTNCDVGCGVLFKLTPDGAYSVLHAFGGGTAHPYTRLVRDPATGDLYGSTPRVELGYGAIFKLTPKGKFTVLYDFGGGADGSAPNALSRDRKGNLYGTTNLGGDPDCRCGVIFKISPKGATKILHTFVKEKLGYPSSALMLDKSGNLYGTGSGAYGNPGSVFRLSREGTFMTLYVFGSGDGADPGGELVLDNQNTIYGTTFRGGDYGHGTIYQLNPDRTEQILYSFNPDRRNSLGPAGLIADENGNFYGVTAHQGTNHYGTVFELVKD